MSPKSIWALYPLNLSVWLWFQRTGLKPAPTIMESIKCLWNVHFSNIDTVLVLSASRQYLLTWRVVDPLSLVTVADSIMISVARPKSLWNRFNRLGDLTINDYAFCIFNLALIYHFAFLILNWKKRIDFRPSLLWLLFATDYSLNHVTDLQFLNASPPTFTLSLKLSIIISV